MATSAEHYKMSEHLLAAATELFHHPGMGERREDEAGELLALSIAHAHLAKSSTPCPPCPPIPVTRKYVWKFGEVSNRTFVVRRPQSPGTESTGAVKRKGIDAMSQMKDNQQVVLSVQAEDAAGNPVVDSGARTWSVDNTALAVLIDNGDGSQTLASLGPVGTVVVTVTDQELANDDGSSGQLFQGSVAIDIVSGPVSEIVVNVGEATDKPADFVPPTPAGGADVTTGGPTP